MHDKMDEKRIERVGARKGYDLWSETYDSTPNPVVAMDSRHTVDLLAAHNGEMILDAGCGTGRNLGQLLEAGSYPIGIDFSLGMVNVATRRWPNVSVAVANLDHPLPFMPASFDAVLCALIGEHLSNLSLTLREFFVVLKPGARLLFSVYHPQMAAAGIEANFRLEDIEYRLGAFHYTVQEHIDFCRDAGFTDIEVREFAGDEALATAVPGAKKYVGFPLLLIVTGKKPTAREP